MHKHTYFCYSASEISTPYGRHNPPSESYPSNKIFSKLNERESECLKYASQGKSIRETATLLFRSEHTVKYHITNAMKKLGASNKTEAVAISIRNRYL